MTIQSEAQKLIVNRMLDRFRQASIGDLVTHTELRKMNKGSSRPHYWSACRAMWLLNNENGAVFATVNREGYKRLGTVDGAAYAGEHSRSRINKASKRGYRRLQNVVTRSNGVAPDQMRSINQHLATFGLVAHLTQKKVITTMPDTLPEKLDDVGGLKQVVGIDR